MGLHRTKNSNCIPAINFHLRFSCYNLMANRCLNYDLKQLTLYETLQSFDPVPTDFLYLSSVKDDRQCIDWLTVDQNCHLQKVWCISHQTRGEIGEIKRRYNKPSLNRSFHIHFLHNQMLRNLMSDS